MRCCQENLSASFLSTLFEFFILNEDGGFFLAAKMAA